MTNFPLQWYGIETLASASFTCGHCGRSISSDKAYKAKRPGRNEYYAVLYICHACNKPTFFYDGEQVPSPSLGNSVSNLPVDIDQLYTEIRKATSVNAYTAAVLAARKLLMHIAVEKGAEENQTFLQYVNYLDSNHYTPPNSVAWVDRIRQLGNDANHEILIMNSTQADLILTFLEMLLRYIYEFPAMMNPIAEPSTNSDDEDPNTLALN